MATGDMKNNIKQLQSELKATKFIQTLDIDGCLSGSPQTYLAIYHYIFTTYNTQLNDDISSSSNELYGKSDMRFMEAVYKILRDIFDYKPQINREQFFSPGYAERKVIMATDVLRLVRRKYKPPRSSTFRVAAAATRDETRISPREKVQQEPFERPRKIANKSPDIAGAIVLRTNSTSAGEGYKIPKSSILGQRHVFESPLYRTPSVTTKICREKSVNAIQAGACENKEDLTETEHSFKDSIIRSHRVVEKESSDSLMRRMFWDLVSPALLKINAKVEKLEFGLMSLEKKEQPRITPDLPSSPPLMAGLTKQMSDVVFKLDTLTSKVVLIENRLTMIEAMINCEENHKWMPSENINYHVSNKEATDSTGLKWSSRNNNSSSSHHDELSAGKGSIRNGDHNDIHSVESSDDEDNTNNPKVFVVREDVKEPKVIHSKMTFIQALVNENDTENTLNSDVSALETSVTQDNQQLPPVPAKVPKSIELFDEMVSPIRSLCGNSQFASLRDESMVAFPHEADNVVSKDDRRSSTPSHFMLDTSTMDRVSRISQMMTDTKQLLH